MARRIVVARRKKQPAVLARRRGPNEVVGNPRKVIARRIPQNVVFARRINPEEKKEGGVMASFRRLFKL